MSEKDPDDLHDCSDDTVILGPELNLSIAKECLDEATETNNIKVILLLLLAERRIFLFEALCPLHDKDELASLRMRIQQRISGCLVTFVALTEIAVESSNELRQAVKLSGSAAKVLTLLEMSRKHLNDAEWYLAQLGMLVHLDRLLIIPYRLKLIRVRSIVIDAERMTMNLPAIERCNLFLPLYYRARQTASSSHSGRVNHAAADNSDDRL